VGELVDNSNTAPGDTHCRNTPHGHCIFVLDGLRFLAEMGD